MPYFSKTYDIFCLEPEQSPATGRTLAEAITQVYGGPGLHTTTLCSANPLGVQLDQAGYLQIASQRSVAQMALFVQRALNHMGASMKTGSRAQLDYFSEVYSGDVGSDAFARMDSYLGGKPDWTEFDLEAACVANRDVHLSVIGSAIGWVCSQEGAPCDDVPRQCNTSTYRLGDFVFSRFTREARASGLWNPLVDCSFGGAALFAPSEVYQRWLGADVCSADESTTTSSTSLTSTGTATSITRTGTTDTTTTMTKTITSTRYFRVPESACIIRRPWVSTTFFGVLIVQMWA